MENTAYTLRGLNADDLFDAIQIVRKIGVKEVKNCFSAADMKKMIDSMEKSTENEGTENESFIAVFGLNVIIDVASLVIEHLPDCKADLYRLLASLSGMQEAEIAVLPAGTFFRMIVDVIKHPSFNDFFQQLVGLFR